MSPYVDFKLFMGEALTGILKYHLGLNMQWVLDVFYSILERK